MSKMIQVRNVPDRVHRELVRRAKRRGLTLTQLVEELLEREVARPTLDEVFERAMGAGRLELPESSARLVRRERESRGSP